MRRRMRRAAAAIAAATLGWIAPAAAQTTAGGGRACYQPRPMPACRSYWVTEFGGAWYTAPPSGGRTPDRRRFVVTWEVGYMRNRATHDAVGATLFLTTNDQFMRSGVRARCRRWMADGVAADIAPSLIVLQADDDLEVRARPGVSLQGGVHLGRWVGLTSELEATSGGVRLLSGLRVGSYAGAAAGLALPVAAFVTEGIHDDS